MIHLNDLTTIQARLFALQDTAYRAFHQALVPGLTTELIGVRVPQVRKLARELRGSAQAAAFLSALPHRFYEENLLHALLLSLEKDFETALSGTERFLPYVDNWAVCDCFCPKVFAKYPQQLTAHIRRWLSSDKTYTVRFAVDMLMQFYLAENFSPDQLQWVGEIVSDEYYINMARAWYFATALAKQQPDTLSYFMENRLDVWTHNKTIQKAIESKRIPDELKAFLRTKKRPAI